VTARPYDVITFDCYGTLIDWEAGIAHAFTSAAARAGIHLDPAAVLDAYLTIERVVEGERYRTYRDILVETARRVAVPLGWPLDAADARFLPESLGDWPPFRDTNPALQRLAGAGYRLGILSNVDDDLLAATRTRLAVPFEVIVTAQQVRSYKPAPEHWHEARRRIGDARWLHAAQSDYHDVTAARRLGIPVAWINRHGQPVGSAGPPDRTFPNLTGLADWLAPA
jgi:2-haloacid dehalogenase/putative hydrolase of the HAD superfamily